MYPVESRLRHQDYQAYFAYMKLGLELTWTWLKFQQSLFLLQIGYSKS